MKARSEAPGVGSFWARGRIYPTSTSKNFLKFFEFKERTNINYPSKEPFKMNDTQTDKLISFLAAGVSQSAAAAACGVSPSLVSQLLESPEVQDKLAIAKATSLSSDLDHDSRLERVQDLVLARVEATVGMITDPMKAVKALQMLSTVKKRVGETVGEAAPTTIVTLDLPASAKVAISLSRDKQVIAIDGRSTATLPSRNLGNMLSERRKVATALAVSEVVPRDLL